MSDKVTQDSVTDAPIVDAPVEESTVQPVADAVEDNASGTQEASGEPDNNIKSMSGKIQSLEKERNTLNTRNKTLEDQMRILEVIDRKASQDPEFKKMANKALLDEEMISQEEYDTLIQTGQEASNVQAPQPTFDKGTQEALDYAKRKKQEEDTAEAEFFNKFEEDKAELTDGTDEELRIRRQAIGVAAAANIRLRGMDKGKAYDLAYKQIIRPELLKEEGELNAMAQAQNTDVSVGGGAGGSATSTSASNLTTEEVNIAQAMGMTPEEYASAKEL